MRYTHKSFAVAGGGNDAYRERWEATFRRVPERVNGSPGADDSDTLPMRPSVRRPTIQCGRCSLVFEDFDGYRLHECKVRPPPGA